MKKFIALMLSMLLVLSMAACGGSTPAQPQQPAAGATAGTTAPAGTTGGTEATNGTTATTAPQKETTQATEETTEPTVEPTVEPTEPIDETFFVKSGNPELGTAIDTSYINEAAGLTCTMPEGFAFAAEDQLLQINEVAAVEELLEKDEVVVAYGSNNVDSVMIVGAFKLGTDAVGGNQDAGDAILHIVEEDKASLEGDNATVSEPQQITVTFTAGKARGTLMTAAANGQEVAYLHVGYEFGDYVIIMMIQAPTEADLEELFLGVDVE